jgi:hypothetical protein
MLISGLRYAMRDSMEQHVRETIQFLTNVKDVPEKLFVEGCWSVLSTPFIAEFLVYLHFNVVVILLLGSSSICNYNDSSNDNSNV